MSMHKKLNDSEPAQATRYFVPLQFLLSAGIRESDKEAGNAFCGLSEKRKL